MLWEKFFTSLMKMSLFPEMMFTEASIQAFTVRGERKDPRILVLGLKASTPFLLLLLPTTTNASNGPPCTTRHGVQDQAGAGVCGEEISHDPQSLENKGRSCGPQFSAEVRWAQKEGWLVCRAVGFSKQHRDEWAVDCHVRDRVQDQADAMQELVCGEIIWRFCQKWDAESPVCPQTQCLNRTELH